MCFHQYANPLLIKNVTTPNKIILPCQWLEEEVMDMTGGNVVSTKIYLMLSMGKDVKSGDLFGYWGNFSA